MAIQKIFSRPSTPSSLNETSSASNGVNSTRPASIPTSNDLFAANQALNRLGASRPSSGPGYIASATERSLPGASLEKARVLASEYGAEVTARAARVVLANSPEFQHLFRS